MPKISNEPGNGKTAASRRKPTQKAKTTRKTTATQKTATRRASKKAAHLVVSDDERRRQIAEAAYLRAEARGFVGGDPTIDWLEAETEVNARIVEAR